MNYKIVLGIIGASIVIGGVVYFVNKAMNSDKDKNQSNDKAGNLAAYFELGRRQGGSCRRRERLE